MKRRHFLGALTAGTLGSALAQNSESAPTPTSAQGSGSPVSTTEFSARSPLVLMAPRTDGIEAVWALNLHSLGRLEWEGEDGSKGVAAADSHGFVPQGEVLRVRLNGLKPGTRYRVRAFARAQPHRVQMDPDKSSWTSPWKSFRTLNSTASSSKFVMWNDTHIHDATIQRLHEVTPTSDFLLWNGDTCNDWTRENLLVPTLLNPGGCDITEGRPLFLTYGNHDVRGPLAFQMPGLIATPNNRPFYAFRSGPIAAICLHTGEDKPDDHPSFQGRVAFDALRAEQAQWLKEIIQQPEFKSAPYRIVFCHIPLRWRDERVQDYDSGGFDRHSGRSRDAWHDTLVEWKTQVILSGHTHQPAWLPPSDEFPYGQLIGGGPQMERATWLEGTANEDRLTLTLHDLAGKVLHEIELDPLSAT